MKTKINKNIVKASIVLCVVLVSYYFTDKHLILNKTQTTYGEPGISIVGMGTDYKRLKKNETGIVNLHYDNQFKNISIVPSSLAKKN
jgi:hypothetical protein